MDDMKTYRYSFAHPDTYKTLPSKVVDSIAYLGKLVLVEGEYDEEGNEITPPILSAEYKVDAIWRDGIQPKEWKAYQIEVNDPIHKFS